MSVVSNKRVRNQRGYTLVEMMVVVSIIGILAAVGIPRLFGYVRTSETTEVTRAVSGISAAITGYADSQIKTAATLKTELDGKTLTPDASGADELTGLLPQVRLPVDGNFDYVIDAEVATAGPQNGEVVFCIKATGRSTASVAGGQLLYSSTETSAQGWDGRINRFPFVNGQTDLTGVNAGGYCAATGVVQATCTSC